MNLEILTSARHIVTGMKQTVKAVEGDKAQHVFIAKDADDRIIRLIEVACTAKGVSVTYVDSMDELGKACHIKVNAAMAAILLED